MSRFCKLLLLISLMISIQAWSQTEEYFQQGTREFGLTNLGISHSSTTGTSVSAGTRFQYYVINRLSLGGSAFYNNFNDHEWMGLGPVASYILFAYQRWFSRLDQQVTFAKFNGFDKEDDPATTYGTSTISLNYFPQMTGFFIGAGYSHSYALNDGEVFRPNIIQLNAGWMF